MDKIDSPDEAILDIYRKMRPSSPPTQEVANNFFNNLFFNINTYDLSKVGRLKLNYRLNFDVPLDQRTLRKEDILGTVKELITLKNSEAMVDDIDNLGNRRVRAVGELLENQYRIGLVRMERAIKERMSLQEVETLMPHDLINSKPVSAVVQGIFRNKPAFPIHGSDQSIIGSHPQTKIERLRSRRFDERKGGI